MVLRKSLPMHPKHSQQLNVGIALWSAKPFVVSGQLKNGMSTCGDGVSHYVLMRRASQSFLVPRVQIALDAGSQGGRPG